MDDASLGDLGDVLEARRRIVAAFEGIAAGAEALAAVAAQAAELDRLRGELEDERLANAQLQERIRALREREGSRADQEEELARLRAELADLKSRRDAEQGEIDAVLHALDGGYVPAGPSGSPLRGLVNVLPTGRNFYSVDPKAIPSRLAFQTGQAMAESLLARYLADTGDYPRSVGLSVWGTSAMRTSGDLSSLPEPSVVSSSRSP